MRSNLSNKFESEQEDLNTDADEKAPKYVKINYSLICTFAFLTGTDFAVIIPTLWDRLSQDFASSGVFMGLVMSSYSLIGVISGLVMGKMSDNLNKNKPFFIISILICVFGQILYFFGINKYIVLLARALSGFCIGASPVALAFIAKTSKEKNRTSILSIVMASRQLGLMFGPAFNILLRKSNFKLFNETISIDRKSAPGLFMAFAWSLFMILFCILFKENKFLFKAKDEVSFENRKFIYKQEFLRIEIFVLLIVTFFTYFNQTSLETMVIPFTEIMFGWNELHNSILFCIGGGLIIISYILIRILAIKLNDRVILLMGLVSIFLGLAVACSCLPFTKQFDLIKHNGNYNINNYSILANNTNNENFIISNKQYDLKFIPAFVVFVVFDVLGLPAIAICSASLFSKLINNKVQGFGQGIQRGILGIGTIVGPLLAGPFIYKPIYLIAITLFLNLLIIFLMCIFFKKLKIKS